MGGAAERDGELTRLMYGFRPASLIVPLTNDSGHVEGSEARQGRCSRVCQGCVWLTCDAVWAQEKVVNGDRQCYYVKCL